MGLAIIHSNEALLEGLASNLEEYSPYVFKDVNDFFCVNQKVWEGLSLVVMELNQGNVKPQQIVREVRRRGFSDIGFLFLGNNAKTEDKLKVDPFINFLPLPFFRSILQFKVDTLLKGTGKYCFRTFYSGERIDFSSFKSASLVSGEVKVGSVNFKRNFKNKTELLELSSFKNVEVVSESELLIEISIRKKVVRNEPIAC